MVSVNVIYINIYILYIACDQDHCGNLCPIGQYFNESTSPGNCQLCNALCPSCFGESDQECYTCVVGHVRTNFSWCVPITCQSNEYLPPGTNICQPCANNCISCESHHNCSVCDPQYMLFSDSGLCFLSPPKGTYLHSTLSLNSCPVNCKECTNSECTLCIQGLFLYEGNCLISCPLDAYYLGPNTNQCIKCHSTCATCNGKTQYNCTSCPGQTALLDYSHQCLLFCNISSYLDTTHMLCKCNIYIYIY